MQPHVCQAIKSIFVYDKGLAQPNRSTVMNGHRFPDCRLGALAILPSLSIALAVSGCASSPPDNVGIRTCKDAGLNWAIGQQAEESVMRRLYSESGAGLVNPIGPNSRTRRDSRTDRLRVYIDRDNVITRAACE